MQPVTKIMQPVQNIQDNTKEYNISKIIQNNATCPAYFRTRTKIMQPVQNIQDDTR